jgi:hypothetical protein
MNLYIDPHSRRLVYFSPGEELPSRAMVVDRGRLHLFTPETLERVEHRDPLPEGLNVQNCWNFRHSGGRVDPA